MNSKQTLKIGLPVGSLADPARGGLKELLDRSRIYTKDYGNGSDAPPMITNIPWLEAISGRPQEFPNLAYSGYIDAFFCGDDWAEEWRLRGKPTEKVLGLNTGKVNIVSAVKTSKRGRSKIRIIASEYPYIARYCLTASPSYPTYLSYFSGGDSALILNAGDPLPGEGKVIIDSKGATEAKAYYDWADAVVEATQSGNKLRNYGMSIVGNVMESECSLYCGQDALINEWKKKKIERLSMMLEGAVNSKGRDLVIFNVGNPNLEKILDYIKTNNLFVGEETVVSGRTMSEITLELPTDDPQRPLIDTLGDLKELGASSIEGIPLSYSIK